MLYQVVTSIRRLVSSLPTNFKPAFSSCDTISGLTYMIIDSFSDRSSTRQNNAVSPTSYNIHTDSGHILPRIYVDVVHQQKSHCHTCKHNPKTKQQINLNVNTFTNLNCILTVYIKLCLHGKKSANKQITKE